MLVAVAVAYGVSKSTTPLYRATTKLEAGASLGGNGNATGYITLAQGGLNQYAEELVAYPLLDQVQQQLKLDMPVEKLQSEIKVVPVTQSLTIVVNVEDKDPNRARDIANKLDDLFLQKKQADATKAAAILGSQNDVILPSVLSPAVTPPSPFQPRTRINVTVAAVLGLLVGVLLVFLIDWLDDTVRTPEEAETLLDTRTLAAIPQLRRGRMKRHGQVRSNDREDALSTLSRH